MKHKHEATIRWEGDDSDFTAGKFTRIHTWSFDGGITLEASASPAIVPAPLSREDVIDPEEAFVAAASSCHMLTFLWVASRSGFTVTRYVDHAVGHLRPDPTGRLSITEIELHPEITFSGKEPSAEDVEKLHHTAHVECFIANSIKSEICIRRNGHSA